MGLLKKLLSIVAIALLLACIVDNVLVLTHSYEYAFVYVTAGIAIAAALSALYYAFRGYSKHAAPSYRAYMVLSAVYFQGLAVDAALNAKNYYDMNKTALAFLIAANCLVFGLMLLLAFAKDLGRIRTTIIGIISIAVTLATFGALISSGLDLGHDIMHMMYGRMRTRLLLTVIAFLLVKFKFFDKAKRGSK